VIDFVFTLDYEIYGNGTGTLKDLVYEPGEQLKEIFHKWDARFVAFVEVAEFEKIDARGADSSIDLVKRQIRSFHEDGFEIALHLHPQWCNARYDQGRWLLDHSEYNLCTLPQTRIAEIIERSLNYLRQVVGQSNFTPLSFRAGNWLFQPTKTAASILAEKGIRVDSSVFKGGLQHNHGLDYRRALNNAYYWSFSSDVNEPDATGQWIEVPIYTEMVSPWRMATRKRLAFGNRFGLANGNAQGRLNRIRDFLRFRYPLKLDFCRMTLNELTAMMGRLIREDRRNPELYRPLVAIGHTKDLIDPGTVDAFLRFLHANGITVSTFETIYPKLLLEKGRTAPVRL
jgi:hypothetical protein